MTPPGVSMMILLTLISVALGCLSKFKGEDRPDEMMDYIKNSRAYSKHQARSLLSSMKLLERTDQDIKDLHASFPFMGIKSISIN